MKQTLLVFFYFLLFVAKTDAQTYWVNKIPLLDTLYHTPKAISQISNIAAQQFLPITLHQLPPDQYLIKNSQGLFVLIDGTGQVYKAVAETKDKLAFTRIDSTYFAGNTFLSINFSWRDTLFSLGGYGFWKSNGELRMFKQGSDWEIVKLNTEYAQSTAIYYYSPVTGVLYYLQTPQVNEVSSEAINSSLVAIQLNLKTRATTPLGKINIKFWPGGTPIYFGSTKLGGFVINGSTGVYLIQFDKNKVYKLINPALINILVGTSGFRFAKNVFEVDGKLYFTSLPSKAVYSLPISINDFELEPYPLYEPVYNHNYIISGLVLLSICSITGLITYKKRKQNKARIQISHLPVNDESLINFNKTEIDLIGQIIQSAHKQQLFSMEDTNQVLGLSKKTLEVQKKIRSESINRINHKFRLLSGMEHDLIDRVRSEQDRRYFQYTISDSNADIYLAFLG
ncbi:hypothetical protein [uncultured Mucilaginibacter sp.]|uniref:hypothetical protein n=1 Tax=uncultured Mucilaginibacter sp. TaxID=797541 RepID=UPI0025DF57A1|nr:hypothetical protein [uncultured Mucilaginibacter sp.]